jgi:hypothetical protein
MKPASGPATSPLTGFGSAFTYDPQWREAKARLDILKDDQRADERLQDELTVKLNALGQGAIQSAREQTAEQAAKLLSDGTFTPHVDNRAELQKQCTETRQRLRVRREAILVQERVVQTHEARLSAQICSGPMGKGIKDATVEVAKAAVELAKKYDALDDLRNVSESAGVSVASHLPVIHNVVGSTRLNGSRLSELLRELQSDGYITGKEPWLKDVMFEF